MQGVPNIRIAGVLQHTIEFEATWHSSIGEGSNKRKGEEHSNDLLARV